MNRCLFLGILTALLSTAAIGSGYEPGAVANGGAIRGTVRLSGEAPAMPPQPVYKHADVCGAEIRDERLIVGASGGLRNAVVALVDVARGKPVPTDQPLVLDNVKCAFVPHVAVATVGQELLLRNSDPFLHDAHAWLGSRTLFNVAIPKGRTVKRSLTEAGLIHVNCNVRHTWMRAYLYVSDNPYHAVTDDAGGFAIEDVPPGTYKLKVWHELLGSVDREVKVEGGKTTDLEIQMSATAPEE